MGWKKYSRWDNHGQTTCGRNTVNRKYSQVVSLSKENRRGNMTENKILKGLIGHVLEHVLP